MTLFYQSAFMEALGWSLVDSLWKMGSLYIAYIIITGNEKRWSASSRYLLAVVLMLAGTLWSFTGLYGYYHDIVAGRQIYLFSFDFQASLQVWAFAEWLMPCLSSVYILMILFLSGKLTYQYYSGHQLVAKDPEEPNDVLKEILYRLVTTTGIKKKVGIFFSNKVDTPATIGFLKPLILFPVAAFNQLNMEQAECVIAHELFHIRRNDYLVNILVSISRVILFFNPFASLFQHIIQKEMENACDDQVVGLGYGQWEYAHALYALGKDQSISGTLALAATGNKRLLLQRVSRILKVTPTKRRTAFIPGFIRPVMIFFLCLVFSFFLQKPPLIHPKAMTVSNDIAKVHAGGPAIYQEEKVIITPAILADVNNKVLRQHRKFYASEALGAEKAKPVIPAPPEVPLPPPPADEMVASFVSTTPEETSFTLLIPEKRMDPMIKLSQATTAPYLPSATFYYSNIEDSLSRPGRKMVHL
jgi:beta-lactamase regulating signal transducer with metallopeptidase domain